MKWQFKSSSLNEENIMTKISLGGMDRAVCMGEPGLKSLSFIMFLLNSHVFKLAEKPWPCSFFDTISFY